MAEGGDEAPDSPAEDASDSPDSPAEDASDSPDSPAEDASDSPDSPAEDDAPLGELAREVRARREARDREPADLDEAPDAPETDLFESVDVGTVDDEEVWESFVEGETGPEDRVGLGAEVEGAAEPDEHVVPKRDFCQRCPHFSAPPDTACTHEGTTIVEVVDTDHFRVRNCPIVEDENAESPL